MNRRRFIYRATMATTAVLPSLTLSLASPAPGPPPIRLSTSSIHFKALPIDQACARVARLGFEAIDIWGGYDGCNHLDEISERLGADGLKSLLDQHRLKLCSFSTYIGGYARYAALLGKVGGGLAIEGSSLPCQSGELTAKTKEFLERLKPLGDLAEKYDSFLAIENHGHSLLDSLDSLKAFVDLNTSPRLGIALAPYHLQASGVSVPDAITACAGQLFFFYAWQFQPDLGQLPGIGPTDFKPWLLSLRKNRYRGYVNPFMHGKVESSSMSDALVKARAYLTSAASEI